MSAGGLRVQFPSGPPFYSERSSVFRAPGGRAQAPWEREAAGGNPAVPTNLIAVVAEYMRHPSSKRNDAGGSPADSASLRRWLRPGKPLPGGVKVARRPVKPLVLVRVQVWQPISGCNVSSRRALARGHRFGARKSQVSRACGTTLTISGRQADISWLHLS